LVAVSWYGVARPCALSGFAGTISVQFMFTAGAAALRAVSMRLAPTAAATTAMLVATAMTATSGADLPPPPHQANRPRRT
jgi:hypothetical protein